MIRSFLALILLVAALAVGAYYGSPFYTVWRLEQAAKGGDAHAIAGVIDFPAVRANLSPRLSAALQASIDAEKTKPHSFLNRIGMAIAPFFHSKPADTLVTPEGLAIMLKNRPASELLQSLPSRPGGGRRSSWRALRDPSGLPGQRSRPIPRRHRQ